MVGAIKLAWWRESLEKLDREPPPPEPRLQAAAIELLPQGLGGADLASLEEPWSLVLTEQQQGNLMAAAAMRGSRLFKLAARLLGVAMTDELKDLARSFGAADLGRRGILPISAVTPQETSVQVPRKARPLTMFAALASRDLRRRGPPFEPEGTPGRAWILLRHRLTGRL